MVFYTRSQSEAKRFAQSLSPQYWQVSSVKTPGKHFAIYHTCKLKHGSGRCVNCGGRIND